ncbi:HNH endonuclease family protein [Glaciihabitans sp. dw_435]|uniref:HNH endonuclease family protein n=1 Tax=Glaciihabitans sp. dw_435 TaxID=2720081 RepID=UPI0027DDCC5B|nr:HNH endonuclease family protein [Glaciihabitans sp. dw_435]
MKRSPLAWILVLVVVIVGGIGAAIGTASSRVAPEALPSVSVTPFAPAPDATMVPDPSAAPSLPLTILAYPDAAQALTDLAGIPVKGRAPKTGYDRVGDFGTAWKDVDHNGCDTRNDILARDLTSAELSGPCKVISGVLADPYTAKTIHFVRGNTTSTLVQIDHMVALSNAWQTGAQQLTQDQRVALANDPVNLMAVDGATNSSKGDGDTATWLPPNKAIRCTYVSRQVTVKAKYHLWVTAAEHDAMVRILGAC